MSYDAVARTSAGKHPAAAQLLLEFLMSEEGQKKVGSTYLRIPGKRKVDARYSLERLVPGEKFTVYPNKDTLKSVDDSLAVFAHAFTSGSSDSIYATAC